MFIYLFERLRETPLKRSDGTDTLDSKSLPFPFLWDPTRMEGDTRMTSNQTKGRVARKLLHFMEHRKCSGCQPICQSVKYHHFNTNLIQSKKVSLSVCMRCTGHTLVSM